MTFYEWVKLTEGTSYLIALTFAAGFIVFWRLLTGGEALAHAVVREALPADAVSHALLPATAFLHPAHSWLMLEDNGLARVGVDGFLAQALGRIDAVELPRPGDTLVAGQPAFALLQGERRAEISTPASGVVVEVNPALTSASTLLKTNPYAAGWALRLRPSALAEDLPRLHIAERARGWIAKEAVRLREFIVNSAATTALGPTMADGGEALEGALERLDDEGWYKFLAGGGALEDQP